MSTPRTSAPPSRAALIRRYTWDSLTSAERDAITDSLSIAASRASVGLCSVCTLAALVATARRGKPPLPPKLRYGGLAFFSLLASYAAVLSAAPLYAQRILAVPESRLAEDLRVVLGDWQARAPDTQPLQLRHIDEERLSTPPADPQNGTTQRAQVEQDVEQTETPQTRKSFTYWLGLTKS